MSKISDLEKRVEILEKAKEAKSGMMLVPAWRVFEEEGEFIMWNRDGVWIRTRITFDESETEE